MNSDEEFFRVIGPCSPSIAVIMKHVGGNLRSRWSDFLISDGEKPAREGDWKWLMIEQGKSDEFNRNKSFR